MSGAHRFGVKSLTDPGVREDVEFLLSLNVRDDEICARTGVGKEALKRAYGNRAAINDERLAPHT